MFLRQQSRRRCWLRFSQASRNNGSVGVQVAGDPANARDAATGSSLTGRLGAADGTWPHHEAPGSRRGSQAERDANDAALHERELSRARARIRARAQLSTGSETAAASTALTHLLELQSTRKSALPPSASTGRVAPSSSRGTGKGQGLQSRGSGRQRSRSRSHSRSPPPPPLQGLSSSQAQATAQAASAASRLTTSLLSESLTSDMLTDAPSRTLTMSDFQHSHHHGAAKTASSYRGGGTGGAGNVDSHRASDFDGRAVGRGGSGSATAGVQTAFSVDDGGLGQTWGTLSGPGWVGDSGLGLAASVLITADAAEAARDTAAALGAVSPPRAGSHGLQWLSANPRSRSQQVLESLAPLSKPLPPFTCDLVDV